MLVLCKSVVVDLGLNKQEIYRGKIRSVMCMYRILWVTVVLCTSFEIISQLQGLLVIVMKMLQVYSSLMEHY